MATCPACGIESPEHGECPRCHLATNLFDSVREAAAGADDADPAYLRTIGELLATVDLGTPAAPSARTPKGLLSRPVAGAGLAEVPAGAMPSPRPAPTIQSVVDLPPTPRAAPEIAEEERRVQEYLQLGRRLGIDFSDFRARAASAALAGDRDSLEVLAREMFVHLSSDIVEEYESLLGRRNELAQLLPTSSADVELTAVRRAIGVGDLAGAARRLEHVRDQLGQVEQEWQVGRILVTEADLMVTTIRELGGDPGPALGPLEEGRKLFAEGHRAESERLLARAAVALWTVLQPPLLADLRRLSERLRDARASGVDTEPGVRELRALSTELRQRNFVGTIVAYRRLRAFVERAGPPGAETVAPAALAADLRSTPSA